MATTNGSPERDEASEPRESGVPAADADMPAHHVVETGGHGDASGEGSAKPKTPGRLTKKIKFLNRFVDGTLKGIDAQTAVVWLVLFREERDGVAKISHKRLATILGVSERTVIRHIRVLRQNHLLRTTKRGVKDRNCNEYQLGVRQLAKDNPLKRIPAVSAQSGKHKAGDRQCIESESPDKAI